MPKPVSSRLAAASTEVADESVALLLDRLACRVTLAGRQAMPAEWILPERVLSAHDVLRVTGGEAEVSCGSRSFTVRAPGWVLLPAGVPHAVVHHTRLEISVLHFESTLGDGMDALRWLKPKLDPTPAIGLAVGGVFEAAVDAWMQKTPLGRVLANRWLELWFLQAFGHSGEKLTLDPRLTRVLTWLHNNPQRSFKLTEAARQAAVSPSHLRSLFQKSFGASPKKVAQGIRLEDACRLLETSNLTLSEIAFRTGWEDVTGFSRSFRKRYGLPPGAFRLTSGKQGL